MEMGAQHHTASSSYASPQGSQHSPVSSVPFLVVCCRCVSVDFEHGADEHFDLGAMEQPPEDASVAAARARWQHGQPHIPLSDCLHVRPALLTVLVATSFHQDQHSVTLHEGSIDADSISELATLCEPGGFRCRITCSQSSWTRLTAGTAPSARSTYR